MITLYLDQITGALFAEMRDCAVAIDANSMGFDEESECFKALRSRLPPPDPATRVRRQPTRGRQRLKFVPPPGMTWADYEQHRLDGLV